MKRMIAFAVLIAAASSFGEATVTTDGGVLSISVPSGETYAITTVQADALNANSYTDVVISGGGKVTTAKIFPKYKGDIHVNEGTFLENINYGLGQNSVCKVYVASGAKLDLNIPSGRTVYHDIDLASGALIDISIGDVAISGLFTIHDDVTLGGSFAPNFRNGTINMNGKTLTAPNGISSLNPQEVQNPGEIAITKASYTVYGPYNHDHLGTNLVLSLAAGCTYRYQTSSANVGVKGDYTNRCEWTLKCSGDLTLQANFGKSAYYGPIFVPKDKKLTVAIADNDVKRFDLYGPVSAGTLLKSGSSSIGTLLLHNTNDIDMVEAASTAYGAIYAVVPEALPANLDNVVFNASEDGKRLLALVMGCSNEQHVAGWSASQIKAVLDKYASASTRAFGLGALEGETAEVSLGITSWDSYKFRFGAYGGGSVTLNDDISMSSADMLLMGDDDSKLVFGSAGSDAGRSIFIEGGPGRFRFDDAGPVTVWSKNGNGLLLPRYNGQRPVVLSFSGATAAAITGSAGHVRLPNGSDSSGTLEIGEGASVTNGRQLQLACQSSGQIGAVLVRGGELVTKARVVVGGYQDKTMGFLEISGGLLKADINSPIAVAAIKENKAKSTIGQVFVKGSGELQCNADTKGEPFSIGAGGTGVYYQVSGVASVACGVCIPRSEGSIDITNGCGTVTLAGGTVMSGGRTLLADRIDSSGTINFNGGVFSTPHLYRTYGEVEQGGLSTLRDGVQTTRAYVNFNGGTYRVIDGANGTAALRSELLGKDGTAPDRVTVFAGGAVFDTNGHDMNLSTPLEAPFGKGVVSIALPDNAEKLTGYISPPYVEIVGVGTNASAVAAFDSAKGEVTGIVITNPGWGYDENTTARLICAAKSIDAGPVTVADNDTSGGLVKKGAGTLTLMATNALGGAMTVEGGVLKLGVNGALGSSSIVCKGGVVDVADGVAYPADLAFDVSNLPFVSGERYVIAKNWSGEVPVVSNMPEHWKVSVRANGDVVVSEVRGMVLVIH